LLDIKLQLAHQQRQLGQLEQAETLYRQVIAADPDNVSAQIALGQLCNQPLSFEMHRELLEKAVRANPESARAQMQLGTLLRDFGNFDEACIAFRKAAELDQENTQPYLEIALITKYDQPTDEVRKMQAIYDQAGGNSIKRRQLGFSLGKIFDDLQEYDTAFEYYREANLIGAVRDQENYKIANPAEDFRCVREIFDADFLRRYQHIGNPDDCPVFIIGMLRSGSTLTEQVICSHPEIYGSGENTILSAIVRDIGGRIGQPFPHGFGGVEPDVLRNGAARYLNELKQTASGEPYITDKTNTNFLYTALISVMLPNARIVYCKRDPRDIGLSYFQHDIPNKALYYYDLARIGELARLSEELMDCWNELMPGKIYVSRYEDLVTRPKESIHNLLDFCGLDFDSACLEFFKTKLEVKTVSRAQVRQPMHSKSIGRWKNYEKHLQPLINALRLD